MTKPRFHMLFLGFGFSAQALARRLDRSVFHITGTSRSKEGLANIEGAGCEAVPYDSMTAIPDDVTHIVTSVPPDASGDPVLQKFAESLGKLPPNLQWLAYLSTTGVYGDHGGAWVDETTPLAPNTERGWRRLAAEKAWLDLHARCGLPVHIFRLAGIYGPGRNALESVRNGTARRIVRPGQVFSRIHVDDIAGILLASMHKPNPGQAYNVADDEPAPPQDVIAYAAQLLHMGPPPEIPFDAAEMSPMSRSFFADSKRVSNARVKQELGYRFLHPGYRNGLESLL